MRSTLVALLAAAATLPFLASCSATVEPDGYGYYESRPVYYGPAYYPYPRYHEYHPYYHHYDHYDRRAVERHGPEIHGRIAIER